MSAQCRREGWWIGGCKFEARYDEQPDQSVSEVVREISRASNEAVSAIMASNTKHIYVRDVCVRCGETIERNCIAK
jgi:hypothetical protein